MVSSKLRAYLNDSENNFDEALKAELMDLEQKGLSEIFNSVGTHSEEAADRWTEMKQTLRWSVMVMAHVQLETLLDKLCKELAEEKKLNIKLTDFTSSGIDRAQNYLNKAIGLTIDGSTLGQVPSFTALKEFQKVRDCIVHANGFPEFLKRDGDKNVIEMLISRKTGLTLERHYDGDRIQMNRQFCDDCLIKVDEFFHTLMKSLGWL